MRHGLLSPLVILVEEYCNELRKDISSHIGKLVTFPKQYTNFGLRVDFALALQGKGALNYIEAKSSMCYHKKLHSGYVHDPVNMAKWYRENEAPGKRLSGYSPVLQVYQYGCENQSKYLIFYQLNFILGFLYAQLKMENVF